MHHLTRDLAPLCVLFHFESFQQAGYCFSKYGRLAVVAVSGRRTILLWFLADPIWPGDPIGWISSSKDSDLCRSVSLMLLFLELRGSLKYIYMRFPGSGDHQRMVCLSSTVQQSHISWGCSGHLFLLPHLHLSKGKSASHKSILFPALAGGARASAEDEVRLQALRAFLVPCSGVLLQGFHPVAALPGILAIRSLTYLKHSTVTVWVLKTSESFVSVLWVLCETLRLVSINNTEGCLTFYVCVCYPFQCPLP